MVDLNSAPMNHHISLWYLSVFLFTFTIVDAQKVGVKSDIGFACFNSALSWNFGCPNELLPFDCRCEKNDFLTTAMNCVIEHADNDVEKISKGWWYIRDQCHFWGNRTMELQELGDIYDEYKPKLIDPSTFNSSIAPGPIDIPNSLFRSQLVGAHDTKYHYNMGNNFAWALTGYWIGIMIAGILTNAIRILCPNVYNIIGTARVTKLRKFFTLPALIGKRHHSPLRLTKYFSAGMPTRGQFIIIIGASILNVASIVSFLGLKGNTPLCFLDQSDRSLHYVANRTGIMAIAQIPFTVLFACRNNPFIYLSGWSYDTFMTYHRWCARWMGTNAIIHAVTIYWSSFREKAVIFKWTRIHNWRGGNLAIYMVIIMMLMALRSIRGRIYEIFKATHIIMFLVFIICMLVHVSDYGWLGWLYSSLAFYGIEYVARCARVIMSGGIQDATFTLAEEGMYRVKIPNLNRKWDVRAGTYVYIRILDRDVFWQSHPFSIFQGADSQEDNSFNICVKAQMGATRMMLQKLIGREEKSFNKKVMIEGPYGYENYVSDYESILLFAGGVGFTAMYSYASHILTRLQPNQYLCMIWVVKDCKSLGAFEPEIMYLSQMRDYCRVRIFVTKPGELELGTVSQHQFSLKDSPVLEPAAGQEFSMTHEKKEGFSSASSRNNAFVEMDSNGGFYDDSGCPLPWSKDLAIHIDYGRPNIAAEVCDFIRTANGSKAICSCGPPMFVDEIRGGIIRSIADSDARVDYFEDAFSW